MPRLTVSQSPHKARSGTTVFSFVLAQGFEPALPLTDRLPEIGIQTVRGRASGQRASAPA